MRPLPPGRVEWVATPPAAVRPRQRPRPERRYTGPPAYPAVPRWGFPPLAWRWPLALPGRVDADPVGRTESLAAMAGSLLWLTAGLAALAAVAEGWRYVLLVRSRTEELASATLAVSDAFVLTVGVLTWLFGMLCWLVVVLWTLRARAAAASRAGMRPARPGWQVVVGVLVPFVNLSVPGSVLAELEHMVLVVEGERERGARPRPSRLVLVWWAVWAVSLVVGWLALAWHFLPGVQAMADDVMFHACSDVAVVAAAVTTARLVKYLTGLLATLDPTELSRFRVLSVRGAPAPERAARRSDARR